MGIREKVLDALDSVTWYNGLAETVYKWADLPTKSGMIICPKNYGCDSFDSDDDEQLQVLWMIAVVLFGDYGTSPRYGWIEQIDEFRQWCSDITETWRASEDGR